MHTTEASRKRDLILMLMTLGNIYLEKGLYGKAAQKFQQVLNFKVAGKDLFVNLSKALIGLKRFDKRAVEIYQKALEYDPNNSKLCTVLAVTCFNEGRADSDAVKIYELALKHKTAAFEKLATNLAGIYFKNKDFQNSKRIAGNLLVESGYHMKGLSYFIQSSWNTGQFDDAIVQLKKLLPSVENKEVVTSYLCLSFLEKKFQGEINNVGTRFSALDRRIIIDQISKMTRFEKLNDLSQYLELKRFLSEKKHWEDLIQSSLEELEFAHVNRETQGITESSENPESANPAQFNITQDFFNKLTPFEISGEPTSEYHSDLTFDDFQNKGSEIFSEESSGLNIPQDAEILVTIEISNYEQLLANFGQGNIENIKQKLYLILTENCQKYRLDNIWVTSNGLIIFANDVLAAVSFSVGVLNRLNRYNFLSDEKEKFHLLIGIHHGREKVAQNNEQTLKDLCTGIKLGIARESDLPADSEPRLTNALQKTDRILLTGKAFRQIRNSERFMMNTIGEVRLKYLSEPMALYEVAWRSPVEDLAFGHIKRLGRYDLLAELANKGIFRVYKAKDSNLQRLVILKAVQSDDFNSLQNNNRRKNAFYQMANSLAQMNHPNIANIYEIDEDQGLTYIVREFIEGKPITGLYKDQSEFNPTRLMQIVYQVCRGLYYSHQLGFYHLNLKPNNIWVGFYDETKITDFQIPKAIFEEEHTAEQNLENLCYRSPEQLLGEAGDGRSDIFTLGAILYEIVTGIKLFDGINLEKVKLAMFNRDIPAPSEHNKYLPDFCEAMIMQCLEKNPNNRFQTVNEMLMQIKKAFEQGVFSNFNSFIAQSRNSI